MEKIFTRLFQGLFLTVLFLYGINDCFRVSSPSGGPSEGIIESYLFSSDGDSPTKQWEIDRSNWERAADASSQVADAVTEFGTQIAEDPEYHTEREDALQSASIAYTSASSVSQSYLTGSNDSLAIMYPRFFVTAMSFWKVGLESHNPSMISKGIDNYNTFLVWMQSHKREDFNY